MCGIAGIALPAGGKVDLETLREMTEAIRHRGPDDEGFVSKGSMALGFRRLSIIDLVTGHQPMPNEDETVWVILNGEIYNFMELRAELEASGHVFKTRSDTECIVHGYEQWKEKVVDKLSGMFAFAVLDTKAGRIFGARDRIGKKPFYYALLDGGGVAFASELKALLQCPGWNRRLSIPAIARYLCYEFVPDPHSIYEGAFKVPPGHMFSYHCDHDSIVIERYDDISFANDCGRISEQELREEFIERIDAAVNSRLVADVPLGVFLSGGIDSSVLTCMMARHVEPSRIKTFTIGFSDKSFDESGHARRVAQFLGTDHHEDMLEPETLIDLMPEVASIIDEPIGDASIVPTFLLSRFAKRFVTVALSGDGGDELFAGYPTYYADPAARLSDSIIPAKVVDLFTFLSKRLPTSLANFSPDFIVKQFFKGISYRDEERHQAWLGSFLPHEARAMLAADLRGQAGEPYGDIGEVMKNVRGASVQDRLLYFYCKFYLAGDILVKTDRASMAVSLECRAPFLDREVVRFSSRLPPGYRLRRMTTKYIIKKSMEGMLPRSILHRPKKGFGIPVGRWLRGPLKSWLLQELAERKIRKEGILDPNAVSQLVNEHLSGRFDRRKQLWTLLVFETWMGRYG